MRSDDRAGAGMVGSSLKERGRSRALRPFFRRFGAVWMQVSPAAGVRAGRRPPGGLGLDAGEDGARLVTRPGRRYLVVGCLHRGTAVRSGRPWTAAGHPFARGGGMERYGSQNTGPIRSTTTTRWSDPHGGHACSGVCDDERRGVGAGSGGDLAFEAPDPALAQPVVDQLQQYPGGGDPGTVLRLLAALVDDPVHQRPRWGAGGRALDRL